MAEVCGTASLVAATGSRLYRGPAARLPPERGCGKAQPQRSRQPPAYSHSHSRPQRLPRCHLDQA